MRLEFVCRLWFEACRWVNSAQNFYLSPCFCLLIISCFLFNSSFGKIQDDLFSQANELYKEKNYDGAIMQYDSIVKLGYASPELFFNLGNAHFKLGHLAPSILNYERAKKLAPSDEDIDLNLKLANLRVVDRVEPVPELVFVKWAKDFVINHSSDGWVKVALLMIWLGFTCGVLFLFVNNYLLKRLGFFIAVATLLLSLIAAVFAYNQYNYERVSRQAILFAQNVYVKSAPDNQSTDLFILREGVKVNLLEQEGDWQKIQLADGKVGWMRKEGLVAI